MDNVKNDCSVTQEEKETLKKNLSEQEQLVERLAGEISKYKKELKVMKNERKKRKENENKKTQVDATLFEERRKPTYSDKQGVLAFENSVLAFEKGILAFENGVLAFEKAKLLTQAQALRHEAETAVNEMEDAAKTQLHNLANQSQVTLSAIEGRLTRSRRRLDEFQTFVRTLTQRLTEQISNKRLNMKQEQFQRLDEEKKTSSMVQACELASSILNMSKADIDELLDVDMYEIDDSSKQDQVSEWRAHVEEILSKEESFATPLIQLFLDIVENLLVLERGISDGSETEIR
ncbi:Hypothetical predicted protein [Paramuricea clavata]|uniref:Uncharacterized protein n=1 Tax=Paramuricea clavata TaxID=317549 RepID=A0A7D9HM46_PARCT|nr:Hypothetical predicted protein [Paramuricea clavata]